MLYDDAEKELAETLRSSVVAKAQRSPSAITKQTSGTTPDGLPVHSFRSLLAYEIETIVPGAYPIPPGMPGLEKYGGLTRARHIHISVMPFLHVPVTTQLYFKDDPNRPGDPWAGHKPQLALSPRSDGKYLKADFDFILNTGLATPA